MSETENSPVTNEYTDNELITLIRKGSDKAFNLLIFRYTGMVSLLSKKYFSPSLTADDWFQEGMIGFLDAVRTYDSDGGASFATYATVCIRNRLNSSLRKVKHSADESPSDVISINDDMIPMDSPENDYIENENYRLFTESAFKQLSETEQKVIGYYLAGFSYVETAEILGISEKSVDNALCRAKSKLKKVFGKMNDPA